MEGVRIKIVLNNFIFLTNNSFDIIRFSTHNVKTYTKLRKALFIDTTAHFRFILHSLKSKSNGWFCQEVRKVSSYYTWQLNRCKTVLLH